MVQRQRKIGNVLLVLAIVFPVFGNYILAQKPMVSLVVSDKKVAPDESVTITVTTNLNGTVKVDYPLDFAVDNGVMHGMEQKMDPSTGKIKTYYYMNENGSFRKAGTYTFFAIVRYKGTNYKSNKVTVTVSEEEENNDDNLGYNSKDPIFGVIIAKKTSVYEGESVLLKAQVFSRYAIYFLEAYKPFEPDKNAEKHVFQNQKQNVEETKYNGKPVLTFDYGKQLLFPISTGKCKIKPFEMALRCHTSFFDKTVTFKSSSAVINVKPLPDGAPTTFIGGVGQFELAQLLGKTDLKQGDIFTLTLVVEGLGNLHNINAPILTLPKGCSVYGDPERKEDYHYTEEGVEGTMTFLYNIQVGSSGTVQFDQQAISYFDPELEKYITVRAPAFALTVAKNAAYQPIVDSSKSQLPQRDLSIKQGVKASEADSDIGTATLIVSIATPICLFGLLLFLFLGKRKKREENAPTPVDRNQVKIPFSEQQQQQDYWKMALETLDEKNHFAIALPKAIIQQLEKHFKQESLTREKALQLMAEKDADVARSLREIIETCDHFRYGFGGTDLDTAALVEQTKVLLKME